MICLVLTLFGVAFACRLMNVKSINILKNLFDEENLKRKMASYYTNYIS